MISFLSKTSRSDEDIEYLSPSEIEPSRFSFTHEAVQSGKKLPRTGKYTRIVPLATFCAMICALLLMDAVLPLRALWFHEALLTQMGTWSVAPSLLLFPGWNIIPPLKWNSAVGAPDPLASWGGLVMLLDTFTVVVLVYIFALHSLPRRISRRFIMRSTLVLGLLFMLIPVVTSSDLYSYIAYARMGIVHGMNPLTTTPRAISKDVVYPYIVWTDQPSAYGPVWTLLTCFFELITWLCRLGNHVLAMLLILRSWGLLMHLGSVALIWSLGGSLQRLRGFVSQEMRLRATLAFAWNPLLLLEACTNAHNDTTLLFVVLLAVWFLVRIQIEPETPILPSWTRRFTARLTPTRRARWLYMAPAILLALGTCLKINLVLLMPGFFFYQWLQEAGRPKRERIRRVRNSIAVYGGLILVLYAPFSLGGGIFKVFLVNPATSQSMNTLAEAFGHLYGSALQAVGFSAKSGIVTSSGQIVHTLSMGLFLLMDVGLCWQVWRNPAQLRNIHGLLRWMAVVWLLYCAVGSPWFWPWYLITFLGLYALIESSRPAQTSLEEEVILSEEEFTGRFGKTRTRLMRLFKQLQTFVLHREVVIGLTIGMFTLYCFLTWAPSHSAILFMPNLLLADLKGLWAWGIPVVAFVVVRKWGELGPQIRQRLWP